MSIRFKAKSQAVIPCIWMILLCMVGFVKDKEVDLVHADKGTHETLMENFRRAENYHILLELLLPDFFGPMIGTHLATKTLDRLIQVDFQEFVLLKYQRYRIHLQRGLGQHTNRMRRCDGTRKNAIRCCLPAERSSSS